jgi:hypothetical protein
MSKKLCIPTRRTCYKKERCALYRDRRAGVVAVWFDGTEAAAPCEKFEERVNNV